MDPSVIIQLVILLILLLLSAFFSSAETALTTVSHIRMRTLAEDGDKRARRVLEVTGDSGKMLSAILIGNNIVNISSSSLATTLAVDTLGSYGAGIATGLLTFAILIFGEVSPKTIATIHADDMSLFYAGPIGLLMKLFTPFIYIVNHLSMALLKLLKVNPAQKNGTLTEDELRTIVEVSHEEGVIESEEHEMINNMFDFKDAQAKEIMVPRIDMTCVHVDCTYEELLTIFKEDKFTRIPVYDESTDDVIGIINIKDLLLYEDIEHFQIRDILRDPFFTYEHKNTAELFLQMRNESISMAIVLDEYGSTAGLITLEDLLEEIVGEIHDEYDDREESPVTKLNDHEYLVQGSMNLEDLGDYINIHLESEDYDSVGGFVFGLLDHLPTVGETVTCDENITFKVVKMEKNRVEQLHISLPVINEKSEESQKNE